MQRHATPLASLFVCLTAVAVIGTLNGPTRAATPMLHTSGNWIQDTSNNNVVLRGSDIPDLKEIVTNRNRSVNQYIDMATDSMQGWYSRVIRIAVHPENWNPDPNGYYNNWLNPAIQHCIARGVYVIIDWHYVADYGGNITDTTAFWNYIAPKYVNNPNVLFEVYNEPIKPNDWSTWKNWIQPVVNNIRNTGADNLILMGSPSWSTNQNGALTNPVTGGNIVYVYHSYPQHGPSNAGFWDPRFGNFSNTLPVFITEWGFQNCSQYPECGTVSGFGNPWKSYINGHANISWSVWCFDDIWTPKMWDQNWNLLNDDNSEGQFAKDWLNLMRNDHQPSGGITTPPGLTASAGNRSVYVGIRDRRQNISNDRKENMKVIRLIRNFAITVLGFGLTGNLTVAPERANAAAKPPGGAIVVWNGTGAGWTNPETSSIQAESADVHGSASALEFKFSGTGRWLGAGWNWLGFKKGSYGTDISQMQYLVFWVKSTGTATDLQINLLSNGKVADTPEHHTDKVHLSSYCQTLSDGAWRHVIIPLKALKQPSGFDAKHVCEIQLGLMAEHATAGSYIFDGIAFQR